jgi:hypothetical protein
MTYSSEITLRLVGVVRTKASDDDVRLRIGIMAEIVAHKYGKFPTTT